jgi:hypothetical protein
MSIGGAFNIIGGGPEGLFKSKAGGGGPVNTARTQAFLIATGITDQTIIDALNAMDTSLISAGLLPSGTGAGKIKVLYPFVGGTAATHKFNFVNPLDTDAAFRLVFNGGFTHSASGCQPNGTNGWANTFLTPLTDFSGAYYEGSYHDNTTDTYNGAFDSTNAFTYISGTDHRIAFANAGSAFNITGAPNNGFHQFMRDGGAATDRVQVNLLSNSRGSTLNLGCAINLAIGALNQVGTRSDYNSRLYKLRAYGSTALNGTEMDNFYNLVVAFQTTLGRA